MREIIVLSLVFFCFSCKPSILMAQEKESEKSSNKKPKFSEKDIYQINPNTIHLIGEVQTLEDESVDICEIKYNHTALIKVVNIIGSGSGIINMLSKGELVQMVFMMDFSKTVNNKKTMFEDIKEGELFKGIVIEKLCKDTNKTNYIISEYTKQ